MIATTPALKRFALSALTGASVLALAIAEPIEAADQIHWTITGPTSVAFDWRGPERTVRYGLTAAYGAIANAVPPVPVPWSSAGPFQEAHLTGLRADTLYHYSIGTGPDLTFRTPRRPDRSSFTVVALGDIGTSDYYPRIIEIMQLVRTQDPAFVLALGDLTYANSHGIGEVERHFEDVRAWSEVAAYMPAWGNHEHDGGNYPDDLRNYKGRFALPNARTSPGSPAVSCCGEDWYWFDYGNVRFIAYPEPWPGALADWFLRASALMDSAEADPAITFVVTFGHRPAYSSGHHSGQPSLRAHLDVLGRTHSKYRLNLNGHSHDYERTHPQDGVVHITTGGGGADLEMDWNNNCPWAGGCPAPAFTAFRAFRHHVTRLRFQPDRIEISAMCGPADTIGTNRSDITCVPGTAFDQTVLYATPQPPVAQFEEGPRMVPAPWTETGYVSFRLSQEAPVTATILDVTGRRVRQLIASAWRPAGTQQVPFDGLDDEGDRLPSGVYFVHVEIGPRTATGRFSIVR